MAKKVLVLATPDADAVGGSWNYLRAHKLTSKEVGWEFVRSGLRADGAKFPGCELIHIDTGGRFDGVRDFDHHHNDPQVFGECATSLVFGSFRKELGDDPVIKDMVKFITHVDRSREVTEILHGQFAPILRALPAKLLALRPILPAVEVVEAGLLDLTAYYEGEKRARALMAEINKGGRLSTISSPFGKVLFGGTERSRKDLRSFVQENMAETVTAIVARYGDNSVGVTLLRAELVARIRLREVERLVLESYPQCVGRTFVHHNGFVLYVHPHEGERKSVPDPDELFDALKYVWKKSYN